MVADLDPFDNGADQLAAQLPVGVIEAALDAAGELVQLSDYQPQCFLLSGTVGSLPGCSLELSETLSGRRDARLELALLEQAILVSIDQSSDSPLAALDQPGQLFTHPRIILMVVLRPTLVLMLNTIRIR